LTTVAATVFDHIESFNRFSRHQIFRLEMLGDIPEKVDLDRFDVVIVHYTLVLCNDYYLSSSARRRLAGCRALKAMFIQDEYRFVDKTISAMREAAIALLFTCVPEEEIEKVYSTRSLPGVTKVSVLTGYVPEKLLDMPLRPLADRQIDIGYRSRQVPAWLGTLGQEKVRIGERVRIDSAGLGLCLDISAREEDRLYNKHWLQFVMNCKAMLGVESGASVFDFSGAIQEKVNAHVARDPNISFEQLHDLYFADVEGKINLAQISPRCFEAAALGTLMILYEGRYSGILKPWRHYVPLKKDHSNFGEVLAALRDIPRATEIVSRAREEIAKNYKYSFAAAVSEIDGWIERTCAAKMRTSGPAYSQSEFLKLSAPDFRTRYQRLRREVIYSTYRFVFGRLLWPLSDDQRLRVREKIKETFVLLRRLMTIVKIATVRAYGLVSRVCSVMLRRIKSFARRS
jgi:hypothetical protein